MLVPCILVALQTAGTSTPVDVPARQAQGKTAFDTPAVVLANPNGLSHIADLETDAVEFVSSWWSVKREVVVSVTKSVPGKREGRLERVSENRVQVAKLPSGFAGEEGRRASPREISVPFDSRLVLVWDPKTTLIEIQMGWQCYPSPPEGNEWPYKDDSRLVDRVYEVQEPSRRTFERHGASGEQIREKVKWALGDPPPYYRVRVADNPATQELVVASLGALAPTTVLGAFEVVHNKRECKSTFSALTSKASSGGDAFVLVVCQDSSGKTIAWYESRSLEQPES